MKVDFNHLPRGTRERLVACLTGRAQPVPILQDSTAGSYVGAVLLGLGGLAILGFGLKGHFGSAWMARDAYGYIVLYGFGFFLLGLGAVLFLRRRMLDRALPFPSGHYVFPSCVLLAQSKDLTFIPVDEIVHVQPTHHYVNGGYRRSTMRFSFQNGGAVTFTAYNRMRADQQLHQLNYQQQAFLTALAQGDYNAVHALDPFFEVVSAGWRNIGEQHVEPLLQARPVSPWLFRSGRIALACSVLALPTWWVRNLASDEIAYRSACKLDTASAYESYLWGGPMARHATEVKDERLPRAELHEARSKNTVEAIHEFLEKYPHSSVDADAQRALKEAIHDEYTRALAKVTVSALREFMKKYPSSDDEQNAKDAIHNLFEKTLRDFGPRACTSDPKLVPFVASLLAYTEAHDSKPIEVRFRHHNSPTLAMADKLLKDDEDDPSSGALAVVSDHFDANDAAAREGTMVKSLQSAFADVFPTDVLTLALGESIPDDPNAIKKIVALGAPTILVDYEVKWSGSVYTSEKSGRRFVGIVIPFAVSMHLAGATPATDDQALRFKLKVEPPDQFSVSYESFADPNYAALLDNGPSDSRVYDVMALRAFDQLTTKLEHVFFAYVPGHSSKKAPVAL